MEDAGEDPIKRAGIISNIVQSISLIPDTIVRSVYVQECSRLLQIDEQVLLFELNKMRQQRAEQQSTRPISILPIADSKTSCYSGLFWK